MRKKTLSIILDAFIVMLVVTIILLIVMIGKRGAAPVQKQEEQSDPLVPVVVAEGGTSAVEEPAAVEEPEEAETERILYATPDTSSSVNVRSGAGTNYDKLGSAYSGEEYEVIGVLSSGWTRLVYNGQEGFIHNDYLDYYYKEADGSGAETKKEVQLSEIPMEE